MKKNKENNMRIYRQVYRDSTNKMFAKLGKRWIYTSLAMITMLGGVGVTPIVLADSLATKQVDAPVNVNDVNSSNQSAAEKMDNPVLPSVNFSTSKKPVTKAPEKKNTTTNKNMSKKAKAAQARNGAWTFTRADFNIEGTTIVTLSNEFLEYYNSGEWDGNLSFPADMDDITTIANTAFPDLWRMNSVDFDNLVNLTTLDENSFYTCQELTSIRFANNPKLKTIGGGSFFGCLSLTQITLGDFDGPIEIGEDAFKWVSYFSPDGTEENFHPYGNGIVTPLTTGSALTAAQQFVDYINTENGYPDADAGTLVWRISGTVTPRYVDQQGKEITQDSNGKPVVASTTNEGFRGDAYTLPAAPTIAGYGDPKVVSGSATGMMTGGPQVVTYEYRTAAQPITIYRVDTDDNELEAPEVISGYVDDKLDLTPKNFDNYKFKGLYNATNSMTRAVPKLNWQSTDANTSVKYGDVSGQSYKFVYEKNSSNTETPNTPSPVTGDKPSGTSTQKPAEPDKLPGTGGKKTPTKPAKTTVMNSGNTTNSTTTLPKAGRSREFLAPILGIVILSGVLAVNIWKKKYKL
ncbi:hypothetical protein EQG49_08065 [Periweissella cryptocerci]|uniref:MucBP domain-containing protein n=1 Tax=Periweissella cryptocerci TaxID=2506420 RepID=A0A4P6YUG3_9LACO|nr:MucBP domain-containing protein [Periweissella cryptocerci]QBO36424.1 hypothetical protein EQG49_08065 [Periweissella cryptocerci]